MLKVSHKVLQLIQFPDGISWMDYNHAPDVPAGGFKSEAPEMHVLTFPSKFSKRKCGVQKETSQAHTLTATKSSGGSKEITHGEYVYLGMFHVYSL